jgi:hypothetical protein
MRQCSIMGGTGVRIPYSLDPLRVLLLNMESCTVQVRQCRLSHPAQPSAALPGCVLGAFNVITRCREFAGACPA